MNVPAQAIILVADGRKAMILRNEGDAKFPNLKSEWVVVDQNPSTSSQAGSDQLSGSQKQRRTDRLARGGGNSLCQACSSSARRYGTGVTHPPHRHRRSAAHSRCFETQPWQRNAAKGHRGTVSGSRQSSYF